MQFCDVNLYLMARLTYLFLISLLATGVVTGDCRGLAEEILKFCWFGWWLFWVSWLEFLPLIQCSSYRFCRSYRNSATRQHADYLSSSPSLCIMSSVHTILYIHHVIIHFSTPSVVFSLFSLYSPLHFILRPSMVLCRGLWNKACKFSSNYDTSRINSI